jgi:hypothetical protein
MKNLKMIIATLALVVGTMTATAHPMSYSAMRNNARFLTDRMAYTLGLSTALLDDLYYINYDYICGVNDYLDDVALGYYYDDYMDVLRRRDIALQRLLTSAQWAALMTYDYFYRPISFVDRAWRFALYAFDHRPNYYYYRVPRHFNSYRGGHHFHGMRPVHRPSRPHPNRPSFRLERPGGNGSHVGRPGNGRTNGRPNGAPNVGGSNRPSRDNASGVRPDGGSSNRGDRVTGAGSDGNRSESNMRSSSRASSRSNVTRSGGSSASRSSSSVGRSSSRSSGATRSSVTRSSGGGSSRGSATRGGSERGGRR